MNSFTIIWRTFRLVRPIYEVIFVAKIILMFHSYIIYYLAKKNVDAEKSVKSKIKERSKPEPIFRKLFNTAQSGLSVKALPLLTNAPQ